MGTTHTEATQERPTELLIGTVITGTVTAKGKIYNVEITIGNNAPAGMTPEDHLAFVQGQMKGSNDIDSTAEQEGIRLTGISMPAKIEAYKVAHGCHFKAVEATSEKPVEEKATEPRETTKGARGLLNRVLGR